jgi:hypothetical protein
MAAPLALGVVGLGEVDGDDAVVVPGNHLRRAVGDEIEPRPSGSSARGGERQFSFKSV